jgi:hypothetical protein
MWASSRALRLVLAQFISFVVVAASTIRVLAGSCYRCVIRTTTENRRAWILGQPTLSRCHGLARSFSINRQALPVPEDSSVNAIHGGIASENAHCSLAHLTHACGGASTMCQYDDNSALRGPSRLRHGSQTRLYSCMNSDRARQ